MVAAPERFDLVVIGSGPAGEKGAAQAAYFGKRVAVVERASEPGGASVHTGTLPSKTLRETALYLTGFRRGELYGMSVKLDRRKSLRQLTGRLRDVTSRQERQIRRNLDRHSIELVEGTARFLDSSTVGVFDGAGALSRRLSAEVVLVATGSSPIPPRGITFEDPDVEDSDRILDLDRIPDRLAVIGGGVIGCEYASIFAALGTRVTLVEGRDRLLGFMDGELSAALEVALDRMGAEILLGDAVESIAREPKKKRDALRCRLASGRILTADKILFSAGRRGNTEGLDLAAAGISADERGKIAVDENFRTTAAGVYAVGDVIGFPALAATSMEQARVAVCRAFGLPFKTGKAPLFPYGVYTIPELASIGKTEEELKAAGTAYEVGRSRYENNARGQITGDPDGFVKLVFEPSSRRILGAHLAGASATELVHIPQILLSRGGTLDDFIDMVFNFPTLAECFKYAAYDGLQRLSHRVPEEVSRSTASAAAPSARLSPAARAWFAGACIEAPHAGHVHPVTVAVMDRWRRVSFRTWSFDPSGAGILAPEVSREGFLLAIGAPQGLPERNAALRRCDAELSRRPRPRESIPESVRLFAALRENGYGVLGEAARDDVCLLETCPDDLWRKWARRRLPSVALPSGRRARHDILHGLGLELPLGRDAITKDELDAAACAFAAYLWATDKARVVGSAPRFDPELRVLREGQIVSP